MTGLEGSSWGGPRVCGCAGEEGDCSGRIPSVGSAPALHSRERRPSERGGGAREVLGPLGSPAGAGGGEPEPLPFLIGTIAIPRRGKKKKQRKIHPLPLKTAWKEGLEGQLLSYLARGHSLVTLLGNSLICLQG